MFGREGQWDCKPRANNDLRKSIHEASFLPPPCYDFRCHPAAGREKTNRREKTLRPAGKGFAALAVSTLCALAFAVHPPEALSGDSYLLVKGGAYTPQSSNMDNNSTGGIVEGAVGHFFLPFLSGELGGGYFESKNGGEKLSVYPLTLAARLRVSLPIVKPYAILGGEPISPLWTPRPDRRVTPPTGISRGPAWTSRSRSFS